MMKLAVENASFYYRAEHPIFSRLSFDAESGEIVAVLGANGAGKTTLLRCLTGLLKWKAGGAYLDGENMADFPTTALWKRVAYLPQNFGNFSALSVEDMILLGRTGHIGVFSAPKAADREAVRRVARRLDIADLLPRSCREISGGERRMAALARALAAEPELLILDEPEANLDYRNQLLMLETVAGLARDGICCIWNTHAPDHALGFADKALLLDRKNGALFGPAEDILTAENIRRSFGVEAVAATVETVRGAQRILVPIAPTKKEK